MRRVFTDTLLDDAIKMLDGVNTITAVARTLGVHPDNLSKKLRDRGFTIPRGIPQGGNRKKLPGEEIAIKYRLGMSELELSKEYQCSRGPIRRILIDQCVEIRGQSIAATVSSARRTPEQRQERTKAANIALRGAKRSRNELLRRAAAASAMAIPYRVGKGENELYDLLTQLGLNPLRQVAADIYNIDITVGHVAVELKSGSSGRFLADNEAFSGRIEKLIECGYSVLYVCFANVESLIAAFDEVVAQINVLESLPPLVGKYRVIGCRLYDYTIQRNEREQFTRVAAPVKLHTSISTVDLG